MNWKILAIAACIIAAFFILKRVSFISASKARDLLRQGALVVDVRSPGEFNSGHLPGAINIPLSDFRSELPRRVPDKNKPLLLHCLSGGRSGIARQQARALGYSNAQNLGSYGRARAIAGGP